MLKWLNQGKQRKKQTENESSIRDKSPNEDSSLPNVPILVEEEEGSANNIALRSQSNNVEGQTQDQDKRQLSKRKFDQFNEASCSGSTTAKSIGSSTQASWNQIELAETSSFVLDISDESSTDDDAGAGEAGRGKEGCNDEEVGDKIGSKKKIYNQKFRDAWLQDSLFKGWLEKRWNRPKNTYTAFCKYCHDFLRNGKTDLVKHSERPIHKKNDEAYQKINQEKQAKALENYVMKENEVLELELRIAGFIVRNNLSLSLCDPLVSFLKKAFPDSETARKLSMGKQKFGNIVRLGAGKYVRDELAASLKQTLFSIIIDESTDIEVRSQLGVVAMFWSWKECCLTARLFDLVEVESGTADGLTKAVFNSVDKKSIPRENIIGFSADTTNMMYGSNHSVSVLLKHSIPNILSVKCSCHSIHLCASYACKQLPKELEELIRAIYNHFAHSSSRRRNFSAFQEFVEVAQHKILSPGQTRWLSLEMRVKRILEQRHALTLYFEAEKFDDNTQSNEKILSNLKHPLTLGFLHFVSYALGLFNSFNTTFQSEKPMIHELKSRTYDLLRTFSRNFMSNNYVRDTHPLSIQPKQESEWLPLYDVYLGPACDRWYKEQGVSFTEQDRKLLFTCCRCFYIESVNQIKARFDFSDVIFRYIDIIKPSIARDCKMEFLYGMLERFPIMKKFINEDDLILEFREHVNIDVSWFGKNVSEDSFRSMNPFHYWNVVNLQCFNDQPKFSNLSKFIGFIFSFPFSNVPVERVFSQMKLVKTKQRNSLHNVTLASLLQCHEWYKLNGDVNAAFSKEMLAAVKAVCANKAIDSYSETPECEI